MIYDYSGNQQSVAYNGVGENITTAYDYEGNVVFSPSPTPPIDPSIYDDYSISQIRTGSVHSTNPRQSFAICKDKQQQNTYMFQLGGGSAGNELSTYYYTNINGLPYWVITDNNAGKGIQITSGHGNSAMFSDEYYEQSDDFPLLYVSDGENQNGNYYVYVNRVTLTSAQLIKTLKFPLEQCGYSCNFCFDFTNGIAYGVGYTLNSYEDDYDGSNVAIISKWNMNQLVDNGDGTYTPTFISKLSTDYFIKVLQGIMFHDGMIWVSYGGSYDIGKVVAIDPSTGSQLYLIDNTASGEMEGCYFMSDTELVYGVNNWMNYKVTFTGLSN